MSDDARYRKDGVTVGIDVNLYAEGDVSDAELDAAEAYLKERLWGGPDWGDNWLGRMNGWPERIDFVTLDRYYGPGYERGYWPTIYGNIMALRRALPTCRIHYGGDSDHDAPEVDDEYLAEIWEHFLGPHGADYRKAL